MPHTKRLPDMTPGEIIAQVEQLGIQLINSDGRTIEAEGTASVPPDLKAQIFAHYRELLALLPVERPETRPAPLLLPSYPPKNPSPQSDLFTS